MKLAALAVFVIACGSSSSSGGSGHATPPANHPTGGPARTDQAIALLHQLAAAVKGDATLATIGDPADGVWLWTQPGVAPKPTAHAAAGDAHKVSEVLAAAGIEGGRAQAWVGEVPDLIEHGLTVMDVDADSRAPAYNVDCAAGGTTPPARALMTTKGVALQKEHPDLDDGGPVAQMKTPVTLRFSYGAVEVYFSERDGVLYVADVIVSTPCEV
jgi:hypothetical protein